MPKEISPREVYAP